MIDLFIRNIPVDLPENDISILFQRQRTDYTNPTIVRNSFTKTIRLPGTKLNDGVFSELWKLDKRSSGHYYYYDFNASKRESFLLLKEGNIVEKGYVKLNKIIWDGHFNTYEVTLYGELGNLLYGLSYSIDANTEEVSPLTLADLDLGFNSFIINKEFVENAWKRLDGDPSVDGDQYKIFDTINFMVSYDGAPSANNFDAKSMWCSVDRYAAVEWKDHYYYANEFPATITEDNTTYTYVSTGNPGDHYGLLELKKEISPLEARDLRSYLLRPVINIKKMFEAIGKYISDNYEYTLDMSDEFFSTYDFSSTWMTLSMLYEVDPDVESGSVFTKRQLLSNTSSPASYLISYCKTYGIYLDVDYFAKKLILTRMPRFFKADKSNELVVDISRELKITPLSFDKASYTFDYGEGDSEFLKKYKDTYGIQYGSKKVNTGYRFDASTAPYIDNNIFRQGLDSIDQSVYYRNPFAVRSGIFFAYPVGLMDEANAPTYKLFDMQTYSTLGEVKTFDGTMTPHWYPGIDSGNIVTAYNISNSGYQFMNVWWAGLRQNVWQDTFPKLQCHSEDNKAVDGKNILVKFTGFRQAQYGHITNTEDRTYWNAETYSDSSIDATKVNYLLSDDHPYLKTILGSNCYYDCPTPAVGQTGSYLKVISRLPQFSRASYSYLRDFGHIPAMYVAAFTSETISCTSSATVLKYDAKYVTAINTSSGRQYSYFTNYALRPNHKYFIAAAVKTSSSSTIISGNNYAYPDIIGSTKIDSNDLVYSNDVQLIGSIVRTGDTVSNQITSLSTYDLASGIVYETDYLIAYDLTALDLEDNINTVDAAIQYFGLTARRAGFAYHLNETLDFGISRELYVPACTYESGIGIYNEYWSKYISDMYSIDTRVIECYCYLDNIDEVFREFYYYDNCVWILSKIVDWSMDTKFCKATFIKVNKISNYVDS